MPRADILRIPILFLFPVWLVIGGVCAVIAVAALAFFCLFAILHVAMQIQRREICVTFSWAVFLKVAMAAIAGNTDLRSQNAG